MLIGVDTSGKFLTAPDYQPTVAAAAVGPAGAFEEIGAWTSDALVRWGVSDRLGELHAAELNVAEKIEVCRMLAERSDIRLAAVATDSLLLGSSHALSHHRHRQREKAATARPRTEEGKRRLGQVLKLLDSRGLTDGDYALVAVLPLLSTAALQRAFGYFAGDLYREEMRGFDLLIDEEAAPTIRYAEGTLLATIAGDERFHLRIPEHWREETMHPLLETAMHEDGDGLKPQALFREMRWLESVKEPSVQVADMAAWVIQRAMLRPEEHETRRMFELLRPLLAGEGGESFELFSIARLRPDQEAMYRHLRDGVQPAWWLRPQVPDADAA
jgi:hypothetical protein